MFGGTLKHVSPIVWLERFESLCVPVPCNVWPQRLGRKFVAFFYMTRDRIRMGLVESAFPFLLWKINEHGHFCLHASPLKFTINRTFLYLYLLQR